jgi:hypothetical protein
MNPILYKGSCFIDARGALLNNNVVNLERVKRCYIIENNIDNLVRAWQGHKIEQRWFIAVTGNFKILLIKIDNWNTPNKISKKIEFDLSGNTMDVLHIPPGYVTSIESLSQGSKLLVMSDYNFKEIEDEYRFEIDYFNI